MIKFTLLLTLFSLPCIAASLPSLKGLDEIQNKEIHIEWPQEKNGTVLIFLSSTCPCSDAHIDHIKDLSRSYPELKFVGIHSNSDETLEDGKKYFSEKNLNFSVLRDVNSEWANRLKAYRTPHAYIIDPSGEIVYQGGVTSSSNPKGADDLHLRDTLKKYLGHEKIENRQTRVIGCEISR